MSRLEGFRTLLLDSTCRPLRTLSWQRALVLDVSDRVDVLEYYDALVHSPTSAWPLPAVVRLRQFLRRIHGGVAFSRRNVLLRDDHRCQYCGVRPPLRRLTMDHVLPRSRGGPTSWDNIVTACDTCNRRKGSATPSEAGMPLLSRPARPTILPHRGVSVTGDVPPQWVAYLQAS